MITLLAAIFGKNFLDYRIRILLLVVGITVFTIRARKLYKKYKDAKQAEQDYKVALALHAQAVAPAAKEQPANPTAKVIQ